MKEQPNNDLQLMDKTINRRHFLIQCGQCAIACMGINVLSLIWQSPSVAGEGDLIKGYIGKKLSPYFTSLGNNTIRCELCPHQCEVKEGERGFCRVRENVKGEYYSLVYGNPCAVHVDPIEKKPFFHVLPATKSFSIATAGCNFTCKFCQNWAISQAQPDDTMNYKLSPEEVIKLSIQYQCKSVASTYVEPTIFMEYMLDIGRLCKQNGLLKVMHSNGYVNPGPLMDLCKYLDAACIDLKGITEEYYQEMSGGSLKPVLTTLKTLKQHNIYTEIVTLVIPGKNDDPNHLKKLCQWVKTELGADVPIHFSRFYPTYKLKMIPPTPVTTLEQARQIALSEGLHYVYIGNVPGHEGENTFCPNCQKKIIQRMGYEIKSVSMKNGRCQYCNYSISGIWA